MVMGRRLPRERGRLVNPMSKKPCHESTPENAFTRYNGHRPSFRLHPAGQRHNDWLLTFRNAPLSMSNKGKVRFLEGPLTAERLRLDSNDGQYMTFCPETPRQILGHLFLLCPQQPVRIHKRPLRMNLNGVKHFRRTALKFCTWHRVTGRTAGVSPVDGLVSVNSDFISVQLLLSTHEREPCQQFRGLWKFKNNIYRLQTSHLQTAHSYWVGHSDGRTDRQVTKASQVPISGGKPPDIISP